MKANRRSIRARIRLLSPLAHGSFASDAGNAILLRREPVVSVPGQPLVPVVSANAVRGVLRRLLIRQLLAHCDVTRDSAPSWDRLYAALANGGTLQTPEKRLEPDRIRRVRRDLPAVSLLGAFLYRWVLSGHLRPLGMAWPICRETVAGGLVDADGLDGGEELQPAEALVTETSFARLPDVDEARPEDTGVTPMPVTVEALATGTTLQLDLAVAPHAPDLELSAAAHGLARITHLGGRGAGGLGHVAVAITGEVPPELYAAWLADEEARARARECLLWLPSTWGDL